ncbi:hypothetical protein N7475_007208 [Penicillium sp. IBT 31633x]|nr:hypothetical protein N7475_007208 [Penicillium sp. IBT 31633x]
MSIKWSVLKIGEMLNVRPDQKISTPLANTSSRALLSHSLSHFILTPKIATATMNLTSVQNRHEALLRSRTFARTFWKRLRSSVGLAQGPAQSFEQKSPMSDDTYTDMEAVVIAKFQEELGPLKSLIDYNAIMTATQLALDGRGPLDLKIG